MSGSRLAAGYSAVFPHLADDHYKFTSPIDPSYNCIGWAAEDTKRFWWPGPDPQTYWPPSLTRQETIEAFVEAFNLLGYTVCTDGSHNSKYQKLVLYAKGNKPTHMARQLSDGTWTSKLGSEEDIIHATPKGVEGPAYGAAILYFAKEK